MPTTIRLTAADLADIRFAYSPLLELSGSYHVLIEPTRHSFYRSWVEEAHNMLHGVDLPYMSAVILPRYYIADFLTPTPLVSSYLVEEDLQRLRATPIEVIRSNVETVIGYDGDSAIRQQFLAYPYESLECLIEELRLYWGRVLAHHWERIGTHLENDVLHRARQMALNGTEHVLNTFGDALHYQNQEIYIHKANCLKYRDCYQLNGEGLQLVPAMFKNYGNIGWQVEPEWRPMIIYGARGNGLWYSSHHPDPEQELVLAFGAGRAQLLLALRDPAHTAELARTLHLTAGAVSQQLTRLKQAGLVESNRSGHHVYYRLSKRGHNLIALFQE